MSLKNFILSKKMLETKNTCLIPHSYETLEIKPLVTESRSAAIWGQVTNKDELGGDIYTF